MTTRTNAVVELIPAGTSNAASNTTRGRADIRQNFGGTLTVKLTNGATGPTVAPTVNILIAHDTSGTMPAAGSAGAVWKTLYPSVVGDSVANSVNEYQFPIDMGSGHYLEVEVTGNTIQPVTCEAYLSYVSNVA